MKVIDYFKFIDECSEMSDEEGFKVYNSLLKEELDKESLVDLILEFTQIVCKADLSLDQLENPFEDILIEEAPSPLKLVH